MENKNLLKYQKLDRIYKQNINYLYSNYSKAKTPFKNISLSIVILSLNRIEDTKECIKSVYENIPNTKEVLIWDNNSNEEVKSKLKQLQENYKDLKVIFSPENLGCAGGRNNSVEKCKYDYILFIDNDIYVTKSSVSNMFNILLSNQKIAGVCAKVVFPDLTVQYNGGYLKVDENFITFFLYDIRKYLKDESQLEISKSCDWIPGGATLWRKEIIKKYPIDTKMDGSFEDNELSLRVRNGGFLLYNCPDSVFIHYHQNFKNPYLFREEEYKKIRSDPKRAFNAFKRFYELTGKILAFESKENTFNFFMKERSINKIKDIIESGSFQNLSSDSKF